MDISSKSTYPCWGVGMSPGLPRCQFWDVPASWQVLPCPRRRAEHKGQSMVGGAGAPQPCAILTWGQTQHPPKQGGVSELWLRDRHLRRGGNLLFSWSNGAGRSSAGAMSRGNGCLWGYPYQPFSNRTGPGSPIALAERLDQGCLGFPLAGRDLSSRSSTKEELYQSPAQEGATKGVRGLGKSQENTVTTQALPRSAPPLSHGCGKSRRNGVHPVTQQHPRPGIPMEGVELGYPQNGTTPISSCRRETGIRGWGRGVINQVRCLVGLSPGTGAPGWDAGWRGRALVLPLLPAHGDAASWCPHTNPGTGKEYRKGTSVIP